MRLASLSGGRAGRLVSLWSVVSLCLAVWPGASAAHALLHEVDEGEAVILRFSFPGADPPRFEAYELRAPGQDVAFQSGRLNALGELSFRPDRAGTWQARVITQDGHGAVVELEVDEAGSVLPVSGGRGRAHGHGWRVFAALGYLFGAFGLLALWRARRTRATTA